VVIEDGWDLEWTNWSILKPYLPRGQTLQVSANDQKKVVVEVPAQDVLVLSLVLLLAESEDWVDAGGAESGNVAGRERHGEKNGRDGAQRHKVGGLDAVEHRAQAAEEQER
jgi:hypothetical protein